MNLEKWTEQLLHVWVQTQEEENTVVEVLKGPSFQVGYTCKCSELSPPLSVFTEYVNWIIVRYSQGF